MDQFERAAVGSNSGHDLCLSDNIHERMNVLGACGTLLGTVVTVEGSSIKLLTEGETHYLPLEWVADIATDIKLSITSAEARREWCAAPVGAGG